MKVCEICGCEEKSLYDGAVRNARIYKREEAIHLAEKIASLLNDAGYMLSCDGYDAEYPYIQPLPPFYSGKTTIDPHSDCNVTIERPSWLTEEALVGRVRAWVPDGWFARKAKERDKLRKSLQKIDMEMRAADGNPDEYMPDHLDRRPPAQISHEERKQRRAAIDKIADQRPGKRARRMRKGVAGEDGGESQ